MLPDAVTVLDASGRRAIMWFRVSKPRTDLSDGNTDRSAAFFDAFCHLDVTMRLVRGERPHRFNRAKKQAASSSWRALVRGVVRHLRGWTTSSVRVRDARSILGQRPMQLSSSLSLVGVRMVLR